MAKIYSTRFLLGNPGGSGGASYEVPEDVACVVRDITIVATETDTEVLALIEGLACWGWTAQLPTGAAYVSEHWEGRMVLAAGETLELSWTGQIGYVVSGYLLTLP